MSSCTKEYDEPITASGLEKNNSTVQYAGAIWFDEYDRLVFEDNVLIELIASGALSEEELMALEAEILENEVSLSDFEPYLTEREFQLLEAYNQEVIDHFVGVSFEEGAEETFSKIHVKGIDKWKEFFPEGHYLFQKVSDCEEEAAEAAADFFMEGLIGVVAAGAVSGGAAAPAAAGVLIFSSVGSFAYHYLKCKNQ